MPPDPKPPAPPIGTPHAEKRGGGRVGIARRVQGGSSRYIYPVRRLSGASPPAVQPSKAYERGAPFRGIRGGRWRGFKPFSFLFGGLPSLFYWCDPFSFIEGLCVSMVVLAGMVGGNRWILMAFAIRFCLSKGRLWLLVEIVSK